jgi:hypothetical protein
MHPITNANFFFAGNAIFTVAAPSGERFTFRARVPKNPRPGVVPIFLGVLVGPNNEADYAYAGMLSRQGDVTVTKASRYAADAKPVKVAQWAIKTMLSKGALPEGYTLHHAGRCCRCGRTLTTPESCARGYGDECAARLGLA